jgi:hypothetical protein
MEKEKIKLTVEELQDIVFDDSEEFDVIQHEIVGNWRHGTEETCIVKRITDGKCFRLNYRNSVKDSCEFQDMNYDDEYEEVFPVEETIIVYK